MDQRHLGRMDAEHAAKAHLLRPGRCAPGRRCPARREHPVQRRRQPGRAGLQQHLDAGMVEHDPGARRVRRQPQVQRVIQAAKGQPRHAGRGRDFRKIEHAARRFDDGNDRQPRLCRMTRLRQAFGLGQQDGGHAGLAAQRLEIVLVPGRGGAVDAHPQARLRMRAQEVAQRFARAVLARCSTASSRSTITASAPLASALGMRSGREAGTNSAVRTMDGSYDLRGVQSRHLVGRVPHDASTASVFSPTAGTGSMRGA